MPLQTTSGRQKRRLTTVVPLQRSSISLHLRRNKLVRGPVGIAGRPIARLILKSPLTGIPTGHEVRLTRVGPTRGKVITNIVLTLGKADAVAGLGVDGAGTAVFTRTSRVVSQKRRRKRTSTVNTVQGASISSTTRRLKTRSGGFITGPQIVSGTEPLRPLSRCDGAKKEDRGESPSPDEFWGRDRGRDIVRDTRMGKAPHSGRLHFGSGASWELHRLGERGLVCNPRESGLRGQYLRTLRDGNLPGVRSARTHRPSGAVYRGRSSSSMPTRSLRSRGYLCHTRHQSPLLDPRQVWGRLYQRRWEGSLEESRCGCKKSGEGGLRPCCSSPAQVCPAFQREAEGVPSCDCHTFRRRRGWRRRVDFRWSWKRTAWGAEGVADSHQGAHPRRWGWVSPCPARRGCCWWSSSRRYRLCSGKEASWSRDFTQPLSADPIDGY